jgi:tRNA A37 methylthiotransferase MiaB
VPIAVARQRAKILAELSRHKRLAFAERYIGTTVSVLFESGVMDGLRLGVTANFLKVGVPSNIDLTNDMREVRIIGTTDRWALGQLTVERQHMRRVPVL